MIFVACVIGVAMLSTPVSRTLQAQPRKPNVLLIAVDDLCTNHFLSLSRAFNATRKSDALTVIWQ
jgi:hypothetical protein